MLRRDIGTVEGVESVREGVQIVRVRMRSGKLERAVHYTDSAPLLAAGEVVDLNVTAMDLGLGSGGYHLVIGAREWRADPECVPATAEGHIMKLKYTPMQRSVLAVEEPQSSYHATFLEPMHLSGMPVLLGELHSMLPIAISWLRYRELKGGVEEARKVAYVMSDGGALPLAWSHHVAFLEALGWLETTITYGQAYGGKIEAVNKFSALVAAKHVAKADLCIVSMGPGIVGTGTLYGYSGIETGELVNAVHALGGTPIVIPRISFADARLRHRGISHHTLTALQIAASCPAIVPLPHLQGEEHGLVQEQAQSLKRHQVVHMPAIAQDEIDEALRKYPESITSMGRGLFQDPAYFQAVCAAAEYVYQLHNRQE
ncbi:DUF3866 family protein [Paenibacillus alba]|uniref:DUF3866 family protein n=1 Tax=Paenibacillus alba TaxID=1197127 RepID=UPI0015646ED1|nr:DUF3866 family protein [Paenibacillus alba]NQX64972.1 DUF3866 family protein [Paenibacillus alba]